MRVYSQRPDLGDRSCGDCLKYVYRRWDAKKRKGGEPCDEGGLPLKPGKKRLKRKQPRKLGDSDCKSCPKWKGTYAAELDAQNALELRVAMICLRLGKLPSEVSNEPWGDLQPLMPYLESPELTRATRH